MLARSMERRPSASVPGAAYCPPGQFGEPGTSALSMPRAANPASAGNPAACPCPWQPVRRPATDALAAASTSFRPTRRSRLDSMASMFFRSRSNGSGHLERQVGNVIEGGQAAVRVERREPHRPHLHVQEMHIGVQPLPQLCHLLQVGQVRFLCPVVAVQGLPRETMTSPLLGVLLCSSRQKSPRRQVSRRFLTTSSAAIFSLTNSTVLPAQRHSEMRLVMVWLFPCRAAPGGPCSPPAHRLDGLLLAGICVQHQMWNRPASPTRPVVGRR